MGYWMLCVPINVTFCVVYLELSQINTSFYSNIYKIQEFHKILRNDWWHLFSALFEIQTVSALNGRNKHFILTEEQQLKFPFISGIVKYFYKSNI